jgi:hypothetical protein
MDADQSTGWSGLFAAGAKEEARELDGRRRRGGSGGARSNMTQGAKSKEIVQSGGREIAS